MTGEMITKDRPVTVAKRETPSATDNLISRFEAVCNEAENYARTTAAICNRIGIMYDQSPATESSETGEGFIGAFDALLRRVSDTLDDLGNRIKSIDEAF